MKMDLRINSKMQFSSSIFRTYSLIYFLIGFIPLFGQDPSCLDKSFGEKGKLSIKPGSAYEQGFKISYQTDGKMIVAGIGHPGSTTSPHFFIQRFDLNGLVDSSFADAGAWILPVKTYDKLIDLLILPDDNILLSGVPFLNEGQISTVFKFYPDGKLDSTFGIQGHFKIPFSHNLIPRSTKLVSLPDNKFIAIGNNEGELTFVRFKNSGLVDSTFGINGILNYASGIGNITTKTVAVDPNGSLWLGGTSYFPDAYFLRKFNADGTVDNNFGLNGIITGKYASNGTSSIRDIMSLVNGSMLVLGEFTSDQAQFISLIKYKIDGSLDAAFGNGGSIIDTFKIFSGAFNDLFILPDSNILVSGRLGSNMVSVKYSPNGSIIKGYGDKGILKVNYGPIGYNEISSLIWNPYINKVYALGYTIALFPQYAQSDVISYNDVDITLTRLDTEGNLDTSFGYQAKTTSHVFIDGADAKALAIQEDGKIILAMGIVGGGTMLTRLHTDGSTDRTFGNFGKIELLNLVMSSNDGLLLYNNKILVTGSKGLALTVCVLSIDGIPDTSFNKVGQEILTLNKYMTGSAIVVQNDKILIAGSYSNNSFTDFDFLVIRLLFNGKIDSTFGINGLSIIPFGNNKDEASHLKIRKNGKIVVIGEAEINFTSYLAIVQLNKNGTLDNTFGKNGKVETSFINKQSWATSALLMDDNKIITAGGITNVTMLRFLENGSVDSTFSKDGYIDHYSDLTDYGNIYSLAYDGNQVVAGGQIGLDKIMLANISNVGKVSSPCGGNKQVLISDLFKDDWENLIDMKFDNNGQLCAFGTQQPSPNIYNTSFILRFDALSTNLAEPSDYQDYYTLYPNPAHNFITIKPKEINISNYSISITNILGEKVFTNKLLNNNENIDISRLVNGVYFLIIKDNINQIIKKFIKI